MPVNQKLTRIISGRTVKAAAQSGSALNVTFGDGSNMRIKTGGSVDAAAIVEHIVRHVRQAGQELSLVFQDGAEMVIPLAEETSSVMLRDAAGEMEYAD